EKIVSDYAAALYTMEETIERISHATVPDAATQELRADEMTANEAIELVLKRPGMYGLVPNNEHRSMKAERDAALARIAELEAELEVAMRPHSECERSGAEAGERIVDLEGDLARVEARIAEAAKLHQPQPGQGVRYCADCDQ